MLANADGRLHAAIYELSDVNYLHDKNMETECYSQIM